MQTTKRLGVLLAIIAASICPLLPAAAAKPNVVLIFIDDMGYGDIGPFGSKLNRTPNLDRMASQGMKLTSFYAAPVKLVGPTTANLRQHDGVIELDLKRGEEAILYSGTQPDNFDIAPLLHPAAGGNSWGVRIGEHKP